MQLLSGVDISAKHSHEENSSGDETNGRCSRVGQVSESPSMLAVSCYHGRSRSCVLMEFPMTKYAALLLWIAGALRIPTCTIGSTIAIIFVMYPRRCTFL